MNEQSTFYCLITLEKAEITDVTVHYNLNFAESKKEQWEKEHGILTEIEREYHSGQGTYCHIKELNFSDLLLDMLIDGLRIKQC